MSRHLSTRREQQRDLVEQRMADEKLINEIVEDVLALPADRYDVFMQRFGVPATWYGARVIGEILRCRGSEDEADV